MFDIFYFTEKPRVAPHEQWAMDFDHARSMSRTRYFWVVNYLCDVSTWDWIWEPPPWQAHQRHAWSSKWQRDVGIYLVPRAGFSDTNYHTDHLVIMREDRALWQNITADAEWDWSWHPDYSSPPYIYQFGTQWQKTGGPRYVQLGATDIRYESTPKFCRVDTTTGWEIPDGVDIDQFDFTWHPDDTDPPFIYQFGTQHQRTGGPRLVVPGATAVKFISTPRVYRSTIDDRWQIPDTIDTDSFDFTWHPDDTDPPFIYQFGTQHQRTGGPRYVMPGAVEVKYVHSPRATNITVSPHWYVPDGIDIDQFDFTWHPDDTDPPFIYQFGTQHQRTGGPRYVMPGAVDIKFVEQIYIKITADQTPVIIIDHLDGYVTTVAHTIGSRTSILKTVRYVDNYLSTLKRIANTLPRDTDFVWICGSVCDYSKFDFSWHPEQWQAHLLHVFPSNQQKFGDTFYMHVPTFRERSIKCQLLDWYDINFTEISVPRWPMPVFKHQHDVHVEAVKQATFTSPMALFTVADSCQPDVDISLWRKQTKTIVPLDRGASRVIIPRVCQSIIRDQLYDYPHIDRTYESRPTNLALDIVFISNGEANADQNWGALLHSKQGRPNRCVRVDGINGRAAAYHAAAEASETPWFFAVFAKLEVLDNFDWSWQPDRLQQPKHYIFHALNPVNQLEYGHQAMIAYNRRLTLANPGRGLDFTLDDAHEVVPILSGVARYNVDAWTAWRTAFREVIKLRASLPDVESEYRIRQWVSKGNGPYGQHSQDGAQDALDYYDEVNGDFAELRKSYEWSWLASYALVRRNLAPGQ